MSLPTGREREKLSAQELKEAIVDEKESISPVEPTPAATQPESQPTQEKSGVPEPVTPVATQPVPGVATQPEPTKVEKTEVAPAPVQTGKAEEKDRMTYDEAAKRSGFKSPDDLATSYYRLRRERDKERTKAKAVGPAPVPQAPQPPAVQPPQYGLGYGQAQNPDYIPDDTPVTREELRKMERQMAENSVYAAHLMSERAIKPFLEKEQEREEQEEVRTLLKSDPLYGTKEAQEEINKVFETETWLSGVPKQRETAAWKIARANLIEKNSLPTINRQGNQTGSAPPSGFVESGSPANTTPVTTEFNTDGKSSSQIKEELKKKGIKVVPLNSTF